MAAVVLVVEAELEEVALMWVREGEGEGATEESRARRRRMRWTTMVKARTKARRVAMMRRLELYEEEEDDGGGMEICGEDI